jgi:glycosyltransferase involved in cell wall biosynthesis
LSIAVVIPAYNASKYLSDTLKSVLAQVLPPDEVLVIDDGSTDNTAEIARNFAPRVQVFTRPNARQGASRNFGATQASSEWIAFLDADDLWEPNKLERQMQELAAHPEADLCYTSLISFTEDGDIPVPKMPPVPPASALRKSILHRTTFLPSSVVVRRATFLNFGGFALGYSVAEDWDLWLRLHNAGIKFAACVEPLVRYRIHANNQSRSAIVSLNEAMEVYARLVLPHYSAATRWFHYRKTRSAHESAAAQAMRFNRDPQCRSMMARSLLRFPFNDLHRYKMLLQMLFNRPR